MTGAEPTAESTLPVRPDLDHVIVVVEDLDRAARAYEALGFTVSPRSVHPFGTANRLVVFEHNFIELLALHDSSRLGAFEVVANVLRARGRNSAWGLIWRMDEPERLHADLQEAGLAPSTLQNRITRAVDLPGGAREIACFSSFALLNGNTPTYLEGFSAQYNPSAVYVREWRAHANGARAIRRVCLSTDDLAPVSQRWASMFGGAVSTSEDGAALVGDDGLIEIEQDRRDGMRRQSGPAIKQIEIEVTQVADLERRLASGGPGWLRVDDDENLGASIVLREAGGMPGGAQP